MTSSFFFVLAFVFGIAPAYCFGVAATSEKLCRGRFLEAARPIADLVVQCTWSTLLIYSMFKRFHSSGSVITIDSCYIGAVAVSVVLGGKRRDSEKIAVAAFIFVCCAYAAADDMLLRYGLASAAFASMDVLLKSVLPDDGIIALRYSAITRLIVLAYLTSRSIYETGAFHPIVVGLDFLTVFGRHLSWEEINL